MELVEWKKGFILGIETRSFTIHIFVLSESVDFNDDNCSHILPRHPSDFSCGEALRGGGGGISVSPLMQVIT